MDVGMGKKNWVGFISIRFNPLLISEQMDVIMFIQLFGKIKFRLTIGKN